VAYRVGTINKRVDKIMIQLTTGDSRIFGWDRDKLRWRDVTESISRFRVYRDRYGTAFSRSVRPAVIRRILLTGRDLSYDTDPDAGNPVRT